MTKDQREIQRKLRILRHAEEIGRRFTKRSERSYNQQTGCPTSNRTLHTPPTSIIPIT